MKTIGRSTIPLPAARPCAEALRRAGVHQAAGAALPRWPSTGITQGVYRFATHTDAERHADEALARVMAANAALQKRLP